MTSMIELIEAIKAVGPAPCEGCPNRQACATELLACRDYYLWVDTGLVQHEDRRPSRLWMLRAEDADVDTSDGRYRAYWQGVREACANRGDDCAREAAAAAFAATADDECRTWYRAGGVDAADHDVRKAYRWRNANSRPTKASRKERIERFGLENVVGNSPNPQTAAERTAVAVTRSTETVAVFYEGEDRWTVAPARLQSSTHRMVADTRAFVGVFRPSCPPEWVLESLHDSQRGWAR